MFNDANQLSNVGEASEFLSLLGLKCKYRNIPSYIFIIYCPGALFAYSLRGESLGRREKLPQKVGRREKLAEKVGRREIYPPVPPPSFEILVKIHSVSLPLNQHCFFIVFCHLAIIFLTFRTARSAKIC